MYVATAAVHVFHGLRRTILACCYTRMYVQEFPGFAIYRQVYVDKNKLFLAGSMSQVHVLALNI